MTAPTCSGCGHSIYWHTHSTGRCVPPRKTTPDGLMLDPVNECSCPAYQEHDQ